MARHLLATTLSPNDFVKNIYEKHHTELLLYTRGITKQCLEGEEVMQDFYLKLIKKHDVISPNYKLVGVRYLKVVLRNLCRDQFNAKNKKLETISIDDRAYTERVKEGIAHPTSIYASYIEEIKENLSELEFQVLSYFIEGYPYKETAAQFNISNSHVGVLLSRTRKKVAVWINN